MSSTYSSTLRIELIGDGDQSGIWGQTTNNNLGSLIEQAITGVVTITMVDANYTLTAYNGVVDESRNAIIVATGTNSAQRNIIAPLVEKTYTIKNSTTGGYAVQIIGASGTGVVIPNGVTASVYCDGTNFYNLQVGTTGNETINGNLTVTGTASIAGALSGSTATFSGAISSLSPSFTGTPTAPTASTGTSTTQIATTAFVANAITAQGLGTMATQNANNVNITGGNIAGVALSATVSWAAMPAGTRVMFAQAAAPTGWTQVTSDEANNRMLRVVSSTGAGTGGSSDPTLMNVVPSHTHGYSGTTSGQSADHAHYFSANTGGMDRNTSHNHGVSDPGHQHYGGPGGSSGPYGGWDSGASVQVHPTWPSTTGISIQYTDVNHLHPVSGYTGGVTSNHTHTYSGTTDNGSSQTNWTPRYINMILCAKN